MTTPARTVDASVLVVHQQAIDTIQAMRQQVQALAAAFGDTDPRTVRTALSLAREVPSLFTGFFGDTQTITKDGPLSLFVQASSGFVYGVIFHPDVTGKVPAEDAIDNSGGATVKHLHCFTCDQPVRLPDTEEMHATHVVAAAPTWGSWSFHS